MRGSEKGDRNALAALVRPSSSRHVSSCGWVALCERRRADFLRRVPGCAAPIKTHLLVQRSLAENEVMTAMVELDETRMCNLLGNELAQLPWNEQIIRRSHQQRRFADTPQAFSGVISEQRVAGFARLSGWQPVGNWMVSAANFPASLLPVGVIPTTSRQSRRAVCVGKWPSGAVTRPITQEGRNHPRRRG
jgi:hypothetical protein